MYTKEEIKELKRKFEESRKRYDSSSKELQDLSEKLDGATNYEIDTKEQQHRDYFGEMLKNKKDYNDACISNLNDKLSNTEDLIEKEILKKRFEGMTQKADYKNYGDWDDIMDELNLW